MKKEKYTEEEKKILEELEKKEEDKDSLINILFDSEDDENELMEYLTNQEKEEYLEMKKSEKRLTITVFSILGFVIIAGFVAMFIFSYVIKSDLEKYVAPKMEEYYNSKYNLNEKIESIEYLCKTEKDEKTCSKIIVAKTSDDKSIVSLDEKNFSDNNTLPYQEEAEKYFSNLLGESNIIETKLYISYNDYFIDYNIYLDHMNVLPNNTTFNNLLTKKKLTITGIVFYNNNINISGLKKILNYLGENSSFYLIQSQYGSPNKMTVLNKEKELQLNIKDRINSNKGYTNYNFGLEKNGINEMIINNVIENEVELLETKNIKNPISLKFKTVSQKEDEEKKPTYYLVRFDSNLINVNSLALFKTNYYGGLDELEKEDYPQVYFFRLDNSVYVIGNVEFGFATISKNSK